MKSRLKNVAKELGFKNLSQFAEALGIVPSYFSHIVKVRGMNKRFEENMLARFPRVNVEYILEGKGEPLLPEIDDEPQKRRERIIYTIKEIMDELKEPAREIIIQAIEEYKQNNVRKEEKKAKGEKKPKSEES